MESDAPLPVIHGTRVGSDGRPKCWWVELAEEVLDDELHYLRTEIYRWPNADPQPDGIRPVRGLSGLHSEDNGMAMQFPHP